MGVITGCDIKNIYGFKLYIHIYDLLLFIYNDPKYNSNHFNQCAIYATDGNLSNIEVKNLYPNTPLYHNLDIPYDQEYRYKLYADIYRQLNSWTRESDYILTDSLLQTVPEALDIKAWNKAFNTIKHEWNKMVTETMKLAALQSLRNYHENHKGVTKS